MKQTKLTTLCVALGLAFFTASSHAVDGSDNAGNYSTAWTNGSTGGTGFGPWVLTGSAANVFFTNPVAASSANNLSAIASSNSNAFGIFINGNAARAFASPLQANDRFSITLGHKWDGGARGLLLLNGTNQTFYFSIRSSGGGGIVWGTTSQLGSSSTIPWGGNRRDAGAIYNLTFTKTSNGFTYEFSSPQASPNLLGSGTVANDLPLSGFAVYGSGIDNNNQGIFYFNNLSLTTLNVADGDGDGLTDSWEITYFGDTTQNGSGDPDSDGLTNTQEFALGTSPISDDTDADGLKDNLEVNTHFTNPKLADTDGDTFGDGAEIAGTSAFGMVSDPLKKNYAVVAMPGNYVDSGIAGYPQWNAASPIMNRVSQFVYKLSSVPLTPGFQFKFTAGEWATDWGVDSWIPGATSGKAKRQGGLPNFQPGFSGLYDITFNYDTLDVTILPSGFPSYADFQAAYDPLGPESGDDDLDGITNVAEWMAGTDPKNPDSDADGLADFVEVPTSVITPVLDGFKDALYGARTGVLGNAPAVEAVQTTPAASDSNNLANLSALQVGGKLRLFIGGTPQNTQASGSTDGDKHHYLIFIDSKSGGINQIATNTSTTGNTNDAAQINVLAGLRFDANFLPDYCVKVTGGSQNAWVNTHNLQTGGHYYVGESAKGVVSGDIVTGARSSFASNSPAPYGAVTNGTELILDLGSMGVNLATNNPAPIKLLVILASSPNLSTNSVDPYRAYSDGFGQVLPSVPSGTVSGNLQNVDFAAIPGDQFVSLNPVSLPQVTLLGNALVEAPTAAELPADPGAIATGFQGASLTVRSNYAAKQASLDGAPDGYSTLASYLAVDPNTGWYSSVSRVLLIGPVQLTEAFMTWPTNNVTITQVGSYGHYFQTKGAGITDYPGAPSAAAFPRFRAQLGVAPANLSTNTPNEITAQSGWKWVDAAYNPGAGAAAGRDEYGATVRPQSLNLVPGNYVTISRFTLDDGATLPVWIYGDLQNLTLGSLPPAYTPNYGDALPNYGSFTVTTPTVWYANVQFPTAPNPISTQGSLDVYFQFYAAGITEAAGAPTWSGVRAQLGYGTTGGDPAVLGAYTWVDGAYFTQSGNNDEYRVTLSGLPAGTYYYASRFSADGGATWVYGGINGNWTSATSDSAMLVVLATPSGLSYTPSTIGGTVGIAIRDLSPTVTGTISTYTVDPALPAGLSINANTGVISGTPTAEVASAIYTVTATNAVGSTTTTVTVAVAAPSGSTFSDWSGGAPLTPENLTKYAVGGAGSLAARGEALKLGKGFIVPNYYSYIEAIVRVDDPRLTVLPEKSNDLALGFDSGGSWTTEGESLGVSQLDVPPGCERKRFIYWHGLTANKMFLRLKATLSP